LLPNEAVKVVCWSESGEVDRMVCLWLGCAKTNAPRVSHRRT
jgi:hypothetical protein